MIALAPDLLQNRGTMKEGAMPKTRGPRGSIRGIPEQEATMIMTKVVRKLARNGLDFERSDARALFNKEVDDEMVEAFLFSLQRTIPGIENTGYGQYRLPEDWEAATKNRMWRFRAPPLDILQAKALLEVLQDSEAAVLGELAHELRSELEATA